MDLDEGLPKGDQLSSSDASVDKDFPLEFRMSETEAHATAEHRGVDGWMEGGRTDWEHWLNSNQMCVTRR